MESHSFTSKKISGLKIQVLCHITNSDTGIYDITKIDELVQSILGSIKATKERSTYLNQDKLKKVNVITLYGL